MAVEAAYKGKAAALCCSQSDTALPYLRDMHSWLYIAQANFKAMFLISWAVLLIRDDAGCYATGDKYCECWATIIYQGKDRL